MQSVQVKLYKAAQQRVKVSQRYATLSNFADITTRERVPK